MSREVVFSEGRGLRARVARPEASRGMARLWTSWREAGGRMGGRFGWRYADITGVRSPPLRGVGQPGSDGLAGKTRG
jgi:hypothetical protein